MRHITCLLISLALICLQGCGRSNRKQTSVTRESGTYEHIIVDHSAETTEATESIEEDAEATTTKSLNIPEGPVEFSFRYDQEIDGYTVIGTFAPFKADCETGKVEMHFIKDKESFVWASGPEDIYTSSSIYDIFYSESFTWWKSDTTYTFHYYPPEEEENVDALHPLGFRTPFQFLDIDFDGKKELLISEWSQLQGGNPYYVYRISGGKANLIDYIPFTEIQTSTKIDPNNKSIEIQFSDGYWDSVRFVFVKNIFGISDIDFIEFPESCGKRLYYRFAKTWKSSGFVLKEFEVKLNGNTKAYSLEKGKSKYHYINIALPGPCSRSPQ